MIVSTLERRYSLENPNVGIAEGFTFLELMGGRRTATGRIVTAEDALSVSAVWAAVNRIAGALGSLPVKLYRRRDDGGKDEERGHWAWEWVTQGPNPYLRSSGYKEAAQGHLLLRGNCYTELLRSNTRTEPPVGKLHHPDKVKVQLDDRTGEPWYAVFEEDKAKARPVMWDSMLHVAGPGGNGITGWSVLTNARESIAVGLSAEEYAARFYANDASPRGVLSVPEFVKPETRKTIMGDWEETYGGGANHHRTALLEGGMTYQQIGLSQEDAQFLESRQFQVRDIARWFLIPPHLIGDLENATFSNISEQQIQFLTDTMEPWLVRWEQGFGSKLLTPEERRAGLFFEFVREARLSGDPEKRGNFYTAQVNVGALTPNEVRAKENRNPVPGGERAFIRLDMVPLDQAGQMSVQERASLMLAQHGVATPEVEKRADKPIEKPSFQARYQLRASFRALFLDAADRLIRGEIRNLSRKLGLVGTPDFLSWLEDYYFGEFPDFATRTMGPVFDAYGPAVADAAAREIGLAGPTNDVGQFLALYTESFASRHARGSRNALANMEDRVEAEARLLTWNEGTADTNPRHVQVATRELVQLSEAISKAVWAAGGILAIRWLIVGDSCPYCRSMNGRTVGIAEQFIKQGESFVGEGTDVPLIPGTGIGHPPLHRGCDCVCVPEI